MEQLIAAAHKAADPEKAKLLMRFFKTGKGQYGEGDVFLGIVVPVQRQIAKRFRDLTLTDVSKLLKSPLHECRMMALFILIEKFRKGDEATKAAIFDIYMGNTGYINNWDLVDLSAPSIVGEFLQNRDIAPLREFAESGNLWKKRIAQISLFADIKRGRFDRALEIAHMLVNDDHDLIQKAVGWMLREIGKRGGMKDEERFLDRYARSMPRTALRYALEKFPKEKRDYYMRQKSHRTAKTA